MSDTMDSLSAYIESLRQQKRDGIALTVAERAILREADKRGEERFNMSEPSDRDAVQERIKHYEETTGNRWDTPVETPGDPPAVPTDSPRTRARTTAVTASAGLAAGLTGDTGIPWDALMDLAVAYLADYVHIALYTFVGGGAGLAIDELTERVKRARQTKT